MNRRGFFSLLVCGAVAQFAEHLPRKQTVFGSIPNGTSRLSQMDMHLLSIDHETVAKNMDFPNWGYIGQLTIGQKWEFYKKRRNRNV